MHKTPYQLFRGTLTERSDAGLHIVFSVWKRSWGAETTTSHVSAQGIEDRRHRSRWSEAWWIETPTVQYIIYNIKNGTVWKHVSPAKTTLMYFPLPMTSVYPSFLAPTRGGLPGGRNSKRTRSFPDPHLFKFLESHNIDTSDKDPVINWDTCDDRSMLYWMGMRTNVHIFFMTTVWQSPKL